MQENFKILKPLKGLEGLELFEVYLDNFLYPTFEKVWALSYEKFKRYIKAFNWFWEIFNRCNDFRLIGVRRNDIRRSDDSANNIRPLKIIDFSKHVMFNFNK